MALNEMINEAKKVIEYSYSPYSSYKVSACIETKDNNLISAVNVENSSYGLTMCAERSAIFKAVSMGYKKNDFKSLLIYHPGNDPIPYPCGACLQVMNEFMDKEDTIYVSNDKETLTFKLKDLLPYTFELKD